MKKTAIFVTVLIFLVLGSFAYAGQFGSPKPFAEAGQAPIGVGYLFYSSKWEPDDSNNWAEGEVDMNQVYVQVTYGFIRNWAGYLRVGGNDVKATDVFVLGGDFDSDYEVFGTLGFKGIFYEGPHFSLGAFGQASIFSSHEDERTTLFMGIPVTEKLEYENPWDANFGIAFHAQNKNWALYGGPFLYLARAEVKSTGEAASLGIRVTDSTDYDEKNNIGGFLGVRTIIAERFNLEVEGQWRSKGSIGVALSYLFW